MMVSTCLLESWVEECRFEVTNKLYAHNWSEFIIVHPEYFHHGKILKRVTSRGAIQYELTIRYGGSEYYHVITDTRRLRYILKKLNTRFPVIRINPDSPKYSRKLSEEV